MPADLVLLSRVAFRGREIAGPRLQGLIALLAGDLRTGCGTGRLVEGLWPDEQPENPGKALQILVSRARSQLGADVIARTPGGYRLTLAEDQVDCAAVLVRAAAAARWSRAGDHAAALAHAEAGLARWDAAPPASEPAGDPVAALRAERRTAYQALARARALALARLDRPAEAVGLLAELAADRPRDEEILVELLRCEAATAGPAAALARYDDYRRGLRDELGADPGTALQAEHRRLLRGTAPALRHGVGHEPNPLLGRDADVAAVESLLRTSRVVSIVGPGGLGKTRLANAVARRAAARTVVVVPLAGLTDGDDVAGEVAAALGVREQALATALDAGPSLLVLDNCEHVVAGVAALVRDCVSATAELRILTTSRMPLGLSSESVHQLPELDQATSAQLFRQRARAARPGAELPDAAVAEVCRHLDGLPLAVELAAARVRTLSVPEIARRLDDRFGLLRGAARDAPQRHHTLHAVVDWSWNLLDPAGRAAMRALSVFPDGFTADAAQHVVGGDVLPVLEQLADHSLLKVVDTPSGTRMRMLETVREFSAARLTETDQVTAAFLKWATALGIAHHADLFGAGPYGTVAMIRAEQENLSHALRLALARDDRACVAAVTALLGGLWSLDANGPQLTALIRQTVRPLSHYRPAPELVETTRTALTTAVLFTLGFEGPRPGRALVALRRLGQAPPDTAVRAAGQVLGDPARLRKLCDSTEPLVAGTANLLASWTTEGSLETARQALVRFRDLPWLCALAHCRIAELSLHREDGVTAREHLAAALPVLERLGAWSEAGGVRAWLVLANLQAGDTVEAERWLEGLPPVALDDDQAKAAGYDLGIRAEVRLARGEIDEGLRLWRRVVDRVAGAGPDPWAIEAQAVAVVAHARHGRLDLVADVADALPGRLTHLLEHPLVQPPPHVIEPALCGTLLLAVATADRPAETSARMIALAERFGYLRNFHPTMSAAANRAARDESYATLTGDELRAAALDLLGQRVRSRL
ncbi:AfsR/SARP family transcriptional regulator [Actinoplanes sp. NBC_00393]|uniref:AfsR/SARP family transcriptional regulator n=1 Tax=Actinoplanes sp. NBC_00393 TaxID=2975953 RepID=UPI002E230C2F